MRRKRSISKKRGPTDDKNSGGKTLSRRPRQITNLQNQYEELRRLREQLEKLELQLK
jgi:dsDNA-specific endonuclease/ATPase MutS2